MTNRIVPTILTDSKDVLEHLLHVAEGFTDYVQIDIMDGKFAPTRSVSAQDVADVGPTMSFEVDLMVKEPARYLGPFKDAGAEEVFFYVEAGYTGPLIDDAKNRGLKVGLALLPETPISEIEPYADRLDSIRFFSGHLGYYGGEFNDSVLPKIKEARSLWPKKIFGVDGGVRLTNITALLEAGINYFAVGSRIMQAENPASQYNKFVEAIT